MHKGYRNATNKGKITPKRSLQTLEEEEVEDTKDLGARTWGTTSASRAGELLRAECAYYNWTVARFEWENLTQDRSTEMAFFASYATVLLNKLRAGTLECPANLTAGRDESVEVERTRCGNNN